MENKSVSEILNELRATGRAFKVSAMNNNVYIAEDELAQYSRPVLDQYYDAGAEFWYDLEQLEKVQAAGAPEFPLF